MLVALIIVSGVLLISVYMNWNMFRKLRMSESTNEWFQKLYDDFVLRINFIHKRIKEIDDKNIFEGDDEVGFFFEEIKNMIEVLEEGKRNIKVDLTVEDIEQLNSILEKELINSKINELESSKE